MPTESQVLDHELHISSEKVLYQELHLTNGRKEIANELIEWSTSM